MFEVLTSVGQAALAVLFLTSGLVKCASMAEFSNSLLYLPYMKEPIHKVIGRVLPVAELFVGGGMLCNVMLAKVAAIGMLACFSMVVAVAVVHKQKVPCNCFGVDSQSTMSASTIVRNFLLIVIALPCLLLEEMSNRSLALAMAILVLCIVSLVAKLEQNRQQMKVMREDLLEEGGML